LSLILEIHDLWKAYDEIQALRGLNLEVKRGEMVLSAFELYAKNIFKTN